MQHIVLDECFSTQSSFKEYWAKRAVGDDQLLVSTARQSQGVGRRGNFWFMAEHALAMSCSVKAQTPISLTPLHLGVVTANFFSTKAIPLQLKWPNDLLNSRGEKVGGVLCQTLESDHVLCGIGLNFFLNASEKATIHADYPVGDLNAPALQSHQLARELYLTLLENSKFSPTQWATHCAHMDQPVAIHDGDQSCRGIFRGIDIDGCALVEAQGKVSRIFSGSLRIL